MAAGVVQVALEEGGVPDAEGHVVPAGVEVGDGIGGDEAALLADLEVEVGVAGAVVGWEAVAAEAEDLAGFDDVADGDVLGARREVAVDGFVTIEEFQNDVVGWGAVVAGHRDDAASGDGDVGGAHGGGEVDVEVDALAFAVGRDAVAIAGGGDAVPLGDVPGGGAGR